MSETFSANDELDLSGEGLQPTTANFMIVDADFVTTDDGTRWEATLEPVGQEIEGLYNNQVKDSGYWTHGSREDLVRYGRGGLRRLARAAIGRDAGFTLADLRGQIVSGTVSEDDRGYTRIKKVGSPLKD